MLALRLVADSPVRTIALRHLFRITAAGFDRPLPPLAWRHERLLAQYAAFTAGAAREALAHGEDGNAVRERLRQGACSAAAGVRRALRLRAPSEARAAARALYRCIGIDFTGRVGGDIEVASCYFTRHYDADVCRFIAALDEGILAGLHGGGELQFTQRLTEGQPCCRARFTVRDGGNEG
ncbi:MAG: hypothetical protein ACYC5O_23935 [Anaerolineae bacterium]